MRLLSIGVISICCIALSACSNTPPGTPSSFCEGAVTARAIAVAAEASALSIQSTSTDKKTLKTASDIIAGSIATIAGIDAACPNISPEPYAKPPNATN